jgi:ABC-type multidrug transport system ATPase subunit
MMGVCPQDNVLWDDLTGPEHLRFYGRLKNVSGPQLEEEIDELLKAVNLHEDKSKKARQYSGGMKRRLSVACSLIGHPRIVLLDEPSTGLDPASRRQLWALINQRKKTCAMLLTTHAMEEADVLCDKIGIFSAGELKCIGTSSEVCFFFFVSFAEVDILCFALLVERTIWKGLQSDAARSARTRRRSD